MVEYKTLVKRDVELKSLTENEFANLVKEDYEKAVQIFNEMSGFKRKTNYEFLDIEIDYNYDARPCDRVIHFNSTKTDKELHRAFDSIWSSKNFDSATGWELRAEIWSCAPEDLKFSTNLYIMFPEDMQKELLEKRAEEGEKIQKFYNDLKYKGD